MIGCRWCTELDTYSATRPAVGGVPVLFWVNKLSDSKTDQALLALVVRRSGGKLLDPTVAPVAPCVLVGRPVGRAVVCGAAVGGTGLTVALPVGCAVKFKPPALVGPIVGLLAELLELPNAPMGG